MLRSLAHYAFFILVASAIHLLIIDPPIPGRAPPSGADDLERRLRTLDDYAQDSVSPVASAPPVALPSGDSTDDRAFARFFGIDGSIPELSARYFSRKALEACNRAGVTPAEVALVTIGFLRKKDGAFRVDVRELHLVDGHTVTLALGGGGGS